jgi:endonuclease/exonuclease/phosphatase family metal-dependent hydrolase
MKILTLNTSHTNQVNFRDRFIALAAYMNQDRPDVVLLQEGAGGIAALWMYQCWSTFARLHNVVIGYNYVDYKSFCLPSPWLQYRNAVFTLLPIVGSECIQTPKVSDEGARTATLAESNGVDIVSVHLSSNCNDQGRFQEIKAIHSMLSQTAIIGGDFNSILGSVVWNYLSDMGFSVAGIGVDAVAVRGFQINSCQMVLSGISDHPGVLVELT